MAEEDIYGSKKRYELFIANIKELATPSQDRKYCCSNPANLKYFEKLSLLFDAKDISFVRRLRLMQGMKLICHHIKKDLSECTREDINTLMAVMHRTYNTSKSKETFITDLRHMWRLLFPELDNHGRQDETLVPYVVRHLSPKIDKSREKVRSDKFSYEEFESILNYFSSDLRIQAYLALALESLARPQELLYLKLRDVETHDNYAKLFISEHGKEGIGLLQCIDSFPYLLKWLNVHPLKSDKNAFLFINTGNKNRGEQLKPGQINNLIKQACRTLGINKPITCYSLKRNGVTMRRLRGESDMAIQHAARWTSTKQLKTYDMSNQDEAFKIALQRRGLLKNTENIKTNFEVRKCPYCNELIGFSETVCPKCKHIVSRDAIIKDIKKDEEILNLRKQLNDMQGIKEQIMQEMMERILAAKGG
ncbi:MAG: Phage integrase family protein [Smithella sp. PtaU1.Bin162]|nr:MAG: Phage integrase family protein [Smithella sp. PtaU1.Bin162]